MVHDQYCKRIELRIPFLNIMGLSRLVLLSTAPWAAIPPATATEVSIPNTLPLQASTEIPQASVARPIEDTLTTATEHQQANEIATSSTPTAAHETDQEVAADPVTSLSNKEQWALSDAQKNQALGLAVGAFQWGYYSFYDAEKNQFRSCNAWTFCGGGLFGALGSIDFTQRLLKSGWLSVDIDASAGLGHQELTNSWYKVIPYSERSKTFGLLSLVPTLRMRLPGILRPLRFGLGAGLSYAIGTIPYEYPYDIPWMSAVNAELAFQPSPKSKQEIFLSLRHRCAIFGSLNHVDTAQVGSQWYMLGLRSWF